MPLRFTDNDGNTCMFDDSQKEVVKNLGKENAILHGRVFELEIEKMILEEKLKAAREAVAESTEAIDRHIAYLDPDQR